MINLQDSVPGHILRWIWFKWLGTGAQMVIYTSVICWVYHCGELVHKNATSILSNYSICNARNLNSISDDNARNFSQIACALCVLVNFSRYFFFFNIILLLFFFCSLLSFDRSDKVLTCLKACLWNPGTYRHKIVLLSSAQFGLVMLIL